MNSLTMLRILLFAFTFHDYFYSTCALRDENLNEVFETTTIFFDELKLRYASEVPSQALYRSLDEEINEYLSTVKKSTNLSRSKRQLDQEEGVRVLNGFKEVPSLDLHDAVHASFFSSWSISSPRWYAVTLNSSGIFLFRYKSRTFVLIDSMHLKNGARIKTYSGEVASLIVVQTSKNETQVVRLNLHSKKILQRVQTIETPAQTDMEIWQGMKKIYLAISTLQKISIFVWRGEHFDEMKPTNVGAAKLLPFHVASAMHLLAIDQSSASVLKFSLSLRRFVTVQRLSARTEDAATFHLEKGHNGEYFIAVTGKNSTILYKQSKHRFVPFQRISGAEKIRSLYNEAAILLFLVRDGDVVIYQYDGWKFVELPARISRVFDIQIVTLDDEYFLTLKFHQKEENSTKNNSWYFRSIKWQKKETFSSLREKTKNWCEDLLKKIEPVSIVLPELKSPLKLERAHIQTLHARQINGQNIEKLTKLTKHVNKIISDADEQEKALARYISTKNPKFKNLEAKNIRINCSSICRAEKIKVSSSDDFMNRIRWIDRDNQNFEFQRVKVSQLKKFPCPFPAPKFRDISIDGLLNGISFPKFSENVMRISGNQTLTGSHEFDEIRVENATIRLDVASNLTNQNIVASDIRVNDLVVTSGHFILPLECDSDTVMNGRLTILDAKMNRVPFIRGHINGTNSKRLAETIVVMEPLEINDNVTFRNLTIRKQINIKDFTRSSGKSYNEILSKSIPLDSGRLPIHFKFKKEKLTMKNVTLTNFPFKWLTKKHTGTVIVTGHKNATKPIVTMGKSVYDNLPDLRIPFRVCSLTVRSSDIWESNLVIDRGIGKTLEAENLLGNSELSKIYNDSVTSTDEIPWKLKNLTGIMNVKEAKIGNVTGLDYQDLEQSLERWVEPGRLKGPIKFVNLHVEHLNMSGDIKIQLPLEVRNVETKANLFVEKLNGIDFQEFITNLVKIDEYLSLTNVTFVGSLIAEEIFALHTSFDLQEKISIGHLGSKEIQGTFESPELILSNFTKVPPSDESINIIVNGNVHFVKEPKISNINNKNVNTLFEGAWLTDRPVEISSEYVKFLNATFESDLQLLNSFATPNLGPWKYVENRILSKTKPQTINVESMIKFVQVPNIKASPVSRLKSNITYLKDLELNSLKMSDPQIVSDMWEFEKLIVTGTLDLRNTINGLNLTTDIVRNDVKKNTIKGKKSVYKLKAENIDGLRFDHFAKSALKKNNGHRTVIVKGWKTFQNVEMKNVFVQGTILGRKIENSLLRTSSQTLRGTKIFQNSFTAPEIVTTGTINNVNLKRFVKDQLKKNSSPQIIKSSVVLENNIKVLGNITISESYNGVELRNFKNANKNLESVSQISSKFLNFSEEIKFALENRAFFWDKLELLKENSEPLLIDPPKKNELYFDNLGYCGLDENSLRCDSGIIAPLPLESSDGSRVLKVELVYVSGIPLVIFVTSDPSGGVFIFQYDSRHKKFDKIAGLLVPGIIQGSFTTMMDSLWISLNLKDHSMILRKELWSDFQEWTLPGTENSVMSTTPSKELLIFRNDGVWKLGGLAGPRHICSAALDGQIDIFARGSDYYVQLTDKNITTTLKSRFIGN